MLGRMRAEKQGGAEGIVAQSLELHLGRASLTSAAGVVCISNIKRRGLISPSGASPTDFPSLELRTLAQH